MIENADAVVVSDGLGNDLRLTRMPQRIVSLVPSISESLIELGVGERLVGITNYCVHPADAVASIPRIGGTKGFSLHKIDALKPDLVLANKEENRKQQIEKLREKYPVFVTYPRTVKEALEMVRDLGTLTGSTEKAEAFTEACLQALSQTVSAAAAGRAPQAGATSRDSRGGGLPLRTACLIWRDPWMAAGPDTYIGDLLETAGFENVVTAADGRYPETPLEVIVERLPEVIILPDEPYAFGEKDKHQLLAFLDRKGHRARVVLMDGSYLTWFGTRTLLGLRHLRDMRKTLAD